MAGRRGRTPKLITRDVVEVPRRRKKSKSRDRQLVEVEDVYGGYGGFQDEDDGFEIMRIIEHENGQSRVTYEADPRPSRPAQEEVTVVRQSGDYFDAVDDRGRPGMSRVQRMVMMDDDAVSEITDFMPEPQPQYVDRRQIPGPPMIPPGPPAGYPPMVGPPGRGLPPPQNLPGFVPANAFPPMGMMPFPPPGPPMMYPRGPRPRDFPRGRRSKDKDCFYWVGDQYYMLENTRGRPDAFPKWMGAF